MSGRAKTTKSKKRQAATKLTRAQNKRPKSTRASKKKIPSPASSCEPSQSPSKEASVDLSHINYDTITDIVDVEQTRNNESKMMRYTIIEYERYNGKNGPIVAFYGYDTTGFIKFVVTIDVAKKTRNVKVGSSFSANYTSSQLVLPKPQYRIYNASSKKWVVKNPSVLTDLCQTMRQAKEGWESKLNGEVCKLFVKLSELKNMDGQKVNFIAQVTSVHQGRVKKNDKEYEQIGCGDDTDNVTFFNHKPHGTITEGSFVAVIGVTVSLTDQYTNFKGGMMINGDIVQQLWSANIDLFRHSDIVQSPVSIFVKEDYVKLPLKKFNQKYAIVQDGADIESIGKYGKVCVELDCLQIDNPINMTYLSGLSSRKKLSASDIADMTEDEMRYNYLIEAEFQCTSALSASIQLTLFGSQAECLMGMSADDFEAASGADQDAFIKEVSGQRLTVFMEIIEKPQEEYRNLDIKVVHVI